MKFLVVGLGNPGREYASTRHNVGFKVLDALLDLRSTEVSNASFSTDRLGDVATIRVRGHQLVLLKPSTFMNLSGRAVDYWLKKEKIQVDNLLVVSDDIAIPFGTLRLRKSGSDGGHNGLKDIASVLQTQGYARLRVGVGGDFARGHQVDYVLGEWGETELKTLPEVLAAAAKAVEDIAFMGIDRAMNTVNSKKKE